MFGAVGLYCGEQFLAIIADDTLDLAALLHRICGN
jgi:TfoX/Sxy family transcriptional regulator of competence genes